MSDGPTIDLDAKRVCCPAHGEHLRAQWPKGAAIVMATLAKAALDGDELARACGWREGQQAPISVERINRVLDTRPLCYFVDRATIRQALLDAEILSIVRCQMCGQRGLGGAYMVSHPVGMQEHLVCIECALSNGESLHRMHPNGCVWG